MLDSSCGEKLTSLILEISTANGLFSLNSHKMIISLTQLGLPFILNKLEVVLLNLRDLRLEFLAQLGIKPYLNEYKEIKANWLCFSSSKRTVISLTSSLGTELFKKNIILFIPSFESQ